MDNDTLLEKIIDDLGSNYHDEEEVISNLIEAYIKIASHASNREETGEKLEPYIITAVVSAYLRRGDEGTNSSNEGGLSSSYIDIEDKLKKDVMAIRLGNF